MASGAKASSEGDVLDFVSQVLHPIRAETYRARVDSNAVILVVHLGSADHDIRARADVKTIGIVSASTITSAVVNRHASNRQTLDTVDADGLNGRVLDIQVGDG